METNLTRRAVLAGATAITASAAAFGTAAAPRDAPYRSAIELRDALAARKLSARELVVHALPASRRSTARSTRSWCAISTGRAQPPTRRMRRWRAAQPAAARPADDGQGAIQRRRPADHLGHPKGVQSRSRATRSGARLKAAGAIMLGKTNVPSTSATGRATTRSTARPTIRGMSAARPAAPRAVRRRRWPPVSWRSNRLRHRRLAARARAFLRRVRAQAEPRSRAARGPAPPGRRRCR